MREPITRFVKNISYYSGIIVLLSLAIQFWLPVVAIVNSWPFILLFLYIFTILAFSVLEKYINNKLTYFANAFMLVNFGKLVLFSTIIVIYAWLNRDTAISFTITFFVYYFMLTSYEIVALLKLQKK